MTHVSKNQKHLRPSKTSLITTAKDQECSCLTNQTIASAPQSYCGKLVACVRKLGNLTLACTAFLHTTTVQRNYLLRCAIIIENRSETARGKADSPRVQIVCIYRQIILKKMYASNFVERLSRKLFEFECKWTFLPFLFARDAILGGIFCVRDGVYSWVRLLFAQYRKVYWKRFRLWVCSGFLYKKMCL